MLGTAGHLENPHLDSRDGLVDILLLGKHEGMGSDPQSPLKSLAW